MSINKDFIKALEKSREGVVVHALDGKIVQYNSAALELLKVTEDQLLGVTSFDSQWKCINEEGKVLEGSEYPAATTLRTKKEVLNFVMGVMTPDKRVSWINVSSYPLFEKGKLSGALVIFSDINEYRNHKDIYELTLEKSGIGTWDWDLQDNSLYLSQTWKEQLGYRESELANDLKTFKSLLHPQDQKRVFDVAYNYIEGSLEEFDIQFRLKAKSGEYIWISSRGGLIKNPDGEPIRFIGIHQNIDRKKKNEIKLRQSAIIFESSDNSIMVTDSQNSITSVNRAFTQTTGYLESEVLGKKPSVLKSDKHSEGFYKKLWKDLEEKDEWHGEIWNRNKFGKIYPEWLNIRVNRNTNGSVQNYIAVFSDLSERYDNIKLLNDTYKEINFKNSYLQTVLDTDENLIAVTKRGEKLDNGNRSLFDFLGYSTIEDFFKEHSCICDFFENCSDGEYIQKDMNGTNWLEYLLSHQDRMQKVVIKKKKKKYIFSIRAKLMEHDEEGRAVVVLNDITESEEYEKSLRDKIDSEIKQRKEKEQLLVEQSKMAAIGEVMSSIAHQWRQPLNSITLALNELPYIKEEKGELNDEDIYNVLEQTMSQVQYLSKTIDSFRNFFKHDEKSEEFSACDITQKAEFMMSEDLKYNNIELTVEKFYKNIFGVPNEFLQVIINLIKNAKDTIAKVQENDPNYIGKIRLYYKKENGVEKIIVEDNGSGVDEKIVGRIYEPYFTTKFQSKGTGLGLYIAKLIVERNLNANLYCKNVKRGRKTVGAKFIIEF